jgi:hypothetical protein
MSKFNRKSILEAMVKASNNMLELKVILNVHVNLRAIEPLSLLRSDIIFRHEELIVSIRTSIKEVELLMSKYVGLLLKDENVDPIDSKNFRFTQKELMQGYFVFKSLKTKSFKYLNLSTGEVDDYDENSIPKCQSVFRDASKVLMLIKQTNHLTNGITV